MNKLCKWTKKNSLDNPVVHQNSKKERVYEKAYRFFHHQLPLQLRNSNFSTPKNLVRRFSQTTKNWSKEAGSFNVQKLGRSAALGFGAGVGAGGIFGAWYFSIQHPEKVKRLVNIVPKAVSNWKKRNQDRDRERIENENQSKIVEMNDFFDSYATVMSRVGTEKWQEMMSTFIREVKVKKIEEQEEEIKKLNELNESTKKQGIEIKKSLDDVQKIVFLQEQENNRLNERIDNLYTDTDDYTRKCTELQGTNNQLTSTIDTQNKEIENLENELNSLNERHSVLTKEERELPEYKKKIDLLYECPPAYANKDQDNCSSVLRRFFLAKTELIFREHEQFSDKSILLLSKGLEKNLNPSITKINFYGSALGGGQEFDQFMQTLESNKTVTELDLSWTNVGNEEIPAIARMLKKNRSITSINFAFLYIGNNQARLLYQAISSNRDLFGRTIIRTISFHKTYVTPEEKKKFEELKIQVT